MRAADSGISRRRFVRTVAGGAVMVAGLGPVLMACGSGDDEDDKGSGSDDSGSFGRLTYQFNWINGPGWGASYIADDQGIFTQEGFSGPVDFRYGGPNLASDPVVVAGTALLGQSGSESVAATIRNGGALKILGARFQKNPYAIVSLADNPITEPEQIEGSRIGVGASSEVLWSAVVERLGLDASTITKVPVQFDPSPLVNGEVDGYLGYANNQPVTLDLQGIPNEVLSLSDLGIDLYQQIYITAASNLEDNRDAVLAAMRAEATGLQLMRQDPQAAVDLWNRKYAEGVEEDPKASLAIMKAGLDLGTSAATEELGDLAMSESDIEGNRRTLADLGLEIPEDAYDTSILADVYSEGLDLTAGR